jgi:hypothetical protein
LAALAGPVISVSGMSDHTGSRLDRLESRSGWAGFPLSRS